MRDRLGSTIEVPDSPGFRYVAWHGGGAHTLKIGKRHVATLAALDGSAPRATLCGLTWRRSREVFPDDYWTTGDCSRCTRALGKAVGDA
jgi:hypothetical protein